MSEHPSILLVCLGNICRSPLAEAAFRDAFDNAGRSAHIESAGTAGYHIGRPPDPRAIRVAAAHGIDISTYRARRVNTNDFSAFDYIIALDSSNFDDLLMLAPESASARIVLLLDALPGQEGQSVADPYYGDYRGFQEAWAIIRNAAQAWLTKI